MRIRRIIFPLILMALSGMVIVDQSFADYNVTISSAASVNGLWSGVVPDVWTPTASGSNVSVSDIQTRLNAGTSVIINTTGGGAESGDIQLNAPVIWSSSAILTLSAWRNITINSTITATGVANLGLRYGMGAIAAGNTATYIINAPPTLPQGNSFSTKLGSDGIAVNYTVINTLGTQGSMTAADLQGMAGNLAGNFALGSDIDATTTFTWNSGTGFMPVGNVTTNFTGRFDGLGHTINGLTIADTTPNNDVGIFGYTGSTATIKNIGITNANVSGSNGSRVGVLTGSNNGSITNSFTSGAMTIASSFDSDTLGGLVGYNSISGSISSCQSLVTIKANNGFKTVAGGLVGGHDGAIAQSFAGGAVSVSYNTAGYDDAVGGLVGFTNVSSTISDSYSSGAVSAYNNFIGDRIGGLVGDHRGSVSNCYSSSYVSAIYDPSFVSTWWPTGPGPDRVIGGLIGTNGGSIANSYWDIPTSGQVTSGGGSGIATTLLAMAQSTYSGFDFINTWGITEGVSYPYLKWQFSGPPQIISGTFDVASGGRAIQTAVNGTLLTKSYTGANGFVYQAVPGNSAPNGSALLAYIIGDATYKANTVSPSSGSHITNISLTPNTVTAVNTGDISSTLFSSAKGSLVSSDILYAMATDLNIGIYNFRIISNGNVTQSIPIKAAGLELLGPGGAYTLTNAANNVTVLAGNTGSVSFTNSAATWSIGTVNSTIGLTTTGTVTLSTAGTVTQNAPIVTTGLTQLGGGTYTLPYVTIPAITITKTGPGTGSVSVDSGVLTWSGLFGTTIYPTGTIVTITATPDFGNVFTGWLGACSGSGTCQVTMNNAREVTATFAPATGFTLPVITPFQTGQTACYDAADQPTACATTRQDGELLMGAPWPVPRFRANADQTVIDTLTGLIWAGNGGTPTVNGVPPAICTGGPMSWQSALAYVACLNSNSYLGYTDWRLPNINEIGSLQSKGEANLPSWLNSQGFSGVPAINSFYWSSSTYALYNDSAWYANLLAASEAFTLKNDIYSNMYVWPVRGDLASSSRIPRTGQTTCYDPATNAVISCSGTGQDGESQTGAAWPASRFTPNADQTITDTLTALAWTKDAGVPTAGACTGGAMGWQGALAYVACLNSSSYLGHNDWRLPNASELASLLNRGVADGAAWLTGQGFTNVIGDYYWSSTTRPGDSAFAVAAFITTGSLEADVKSTARAVWPVRGGQSGSYATMTAAPSALAFSDQNALSSSVQSFVSIGNPGGGDAIVSGISITGTDAGQFSVTPAGPAPCPSLTPLVTAGSSCTVGITFTPTSSGAKSAALSIAGNSPVASIVTAPVSGTGLSLVQPTLLVTGLPVTAVYGQTGIIASYSGGGGSGAVSYSAAGSTACTIDPLTGAVTITSGSGTCSITVTKAADSTYLSATATAIITTITPATPTITWANPASITYGTLLSATELNATASVPGTFAYTPAAGTLLNAGIQTLSVIFTPTDTINYASQTGTVSMVVNQATPAITWANPASITYGTPLSAIELNATASVPGTFTYSPSVGAILNTGTQTLSVIFTPTDAVNYTSQTGTVSLVVNQATPAITWANPARITYGTPLSAIELNATASVPGTFTYTPASGTLLTAGTQTLSVTFTPADTINYTSQTGTVPLVVTQATPAITWANPPSITYGTPLSAIELDATASVPGTFTYTPASGTLLTAGTQTLSVTFTPTDAVNYTNQTAVVTILVNPATVPYPSGDINGDAKVDMADALLALQMAVGISTPSAGDLQNGDVAPLIGGVPTPNGIINTGDAVVILQKAVGNITW